MPKKHLERAVAIFILIGLIFTPSLSGTTSFLFDRTAAQVASPDDPSPETPQFESVAPDSIVSSRAGGKGQVAGELKGATEPAIYLIRLKDPAIANYSGGITGLRATTPSVTGAKKLDSKSVTSVAYRQFLAANHDDLITRMNVDFKHGIEVVYQYFSTNNGMAVRLTPEEAASVAQMPGVVFVQRDQEMELHTDAGPAWIGAPGIWDGTTTGSLPGTKG